MRPEKGESMKKYNCVWVSVFVLFFLAAVWVWAETPAGPPLTRDNWGAQVGFAPELNQAGFQPGLVIDQSNVDQFAGLLPETVKIMVKTYGLRLETGDYKPYAPSNGYIAATNKYRGQAKLIDIGDETDEREIEGYNGGLPFPNPQNGREVAWNYTLSYTGDDSENIFKVFWISAKRGVERDEIWKTITMRAKFRTDIPPMPEVPSLVKKKVIIATLTQALKPLDKRGMTSLYFGYFEPREPDGWLYIPSQRRATRLSFGTRGETWNCTDMLYEDVRGYTGSPEWMNWKLVKKATLLAPMHAQVPVGKGLADQVYDFDAAPHWNPTMKWELRPMYVVEATPRLRSYPYSRMVFYIDAESFYIFAKSAYDRRGNLWKLMVNAANDSVDPCKYPPRIALSMIVDRQSEHATAMHWHSQKQNTGVKPNLFTMATLRRLGR